METNEYQENGFDEENVGIKKASEDPTLIISNMKREELLSEIEKLENILSTLKAEQERVVSLIQSFKNDLDTLLSNESRTSPKCNAEKITLFRSLFRGREDVFPKRWENSKSERSGYSPACLNEWNPVLCLKKTGLKKNACSSCSGRQLLPVTDDEITKHLKGQQTIGVYPMLQDETCWFLAVDFDGGLWREDVTAFRETCGSYIIEVCIERSRSGKGAHAWFFFTEPVSAETARKMGCFLLTETMTSHHQLSMTSYDRLFPNQDTMPKGGFGNPIALPLQYHPRLAGNSVFIDENFVPYPDQWEFLSGITRISPEMILNLANEAERDVQIFEIKKSDNEDEDNQSPWLKLPSIDPCMKKLNCTIPAEVQAVLSQKLFIDKSCLMSPVLSAIKRIAAFQNPEFYKKQKMRISTALTPRIIHCFEDMEKYLALPRGCLPEIVDLLNNNGSRLIVDDKRQTGKPINVGFKGVLTSVQTEAKEFMLRHETGVLVAPPGSGKTVIAANLIEERKCNTLVLVHRKPLMEQWIARLSSFLDIDPKFIGNIGAGKNRPTGIIDIAMIQSLVQNRKVNEIGTNYGHVVVDECHHLGAFSFEKVLSEVTAKYITGLTATPQRRDGHHPIVSMQIGPIRYSMNKACSRETRPFTQNLIIRETGFYTDKIMEDTTIQEMYALLVSDEPRNCLIFDDILHALEDGRSPILLTERKDHLEYFSSRLEMFTKNLIVLHGGMKPKARKTSIEKLASIPASEERLLLATGRYIGEGFDDSRLDTLFLALPVSWKGTLVQYAGRLQRANTDKKEVRIYDYYDSNIPVFKSMFKKRMIGYKSMGYKVF
jgi:superfamily II DNA or RNA helicase